MHVFEILPKLLTLQSAQLIKNLRSAHNCQKIAHKYGMLNITGDICITVDKTREPEISYFNVSNFKLIQNKRQPKIGKCSGLSENCFSPKAKY